MELLERQAYCEELQALLRRAAEGRGCLALLGGEAGVGKSALIGQFIESVRGRARVLVGVCDPLSTPRPLGPLLDVASALGGEVGRLLQEDARRDRVFEAVLAELSVGTRPTVFVVEDAHWADEATLDLLRYLGRRIGSTRALMVVTYRDDEVGRAHPLRVVIGDPAAIRSSSPRSLPVAAPAFPRRFATRFWPAPPG
jgi:predicted ATPase